MRRVQPVRHYSIHIQLYTGPQVMQSYAHHSPLALARAAMQLGSKLTASYPSSSLNLIKVTISSACQHVRRSGDEASVSLINFISAGTKTISDSSCHFASTTMSRLVLRHIGSMPSILPRPRRVLAHSCPSFPPLPVPPLPVPLPSLGLRLLPPSLDLRSLVVRSPPVPYLWAVLVVLLVQPLVLAMVLLARRHRFNRLTTS